MKRFKSTYKRKSKRVKKPKKMKRSKRIYKRKSYKKKFVLAKGDTKNFAKIKITTI